MNERRFCVIRACILAFLLFAVISPITASAADDDIDKGYVEYYQRGKLYVKPKAGMVPDGKSAVKIAEIVWLPVYGKEIYRKRPFTAKLEDNVWVVKGTIRRWQKGALICEISKPTGEILRISHEENK